jgi:hypothetical protein
MSVDRELGDLDPEGEWRRDPTGRNAFRFWDGDAWTDRVSNFGVRSVDPMTGSATPVVQSEGPYRRQAATTQVVPPLSRSPRLPPEPRPAQPSNVRGIGATRQRRPTTSRLKTLGGVLVFVGAVTAAIGTLLQGPSGTANVTYLDTTDGLWIGLMSVILALIAIFGVLNRQSSRIPAFTSLIVSGALVAVAIDDDQVLDRFRGVPGLGGWTTSVTVCLVGALVALIGSVIALLAQTL